MARWQPSPHTTSSCARPTLPCRLALASCCPALLCALSSSAAVAGSLWLTVKSAAAEAGLAAWLRRRRGGLRTLHVWGRHIGWLTLHALAGAPSLTELHWGGRGVAGPADVRIPALRSLALSFHHARLRLDRDCSHLSALRSLKLLATSSQRIVCQPSCRLPPALTSLHMVGGCGLPAGLCQGLAVEAQHLRELRLGELWSLPGGASSLAVLAGLWAALLPCCVALAASQPRVQRPRPTARPPAAPALHAWSADMPEAGECGAGLVAVSALTRLTCLALEHVQLPRVPPQWAALRSLEALELSDMAGGGLGNLSGLATLQHLTALTRLAVTGTGVAALPPELTSLQKLSYLDLSRNPLASSGLGALSALTALTCLRLEGSGASAGLDRLPPELAAAGGCRDLRLRYNPQLGAGGDAAFEPLSSLSCLTRLDLHACGLQRVPPQLAACEQLESVDLGGSRALGRHPSLTLAPLAQLPSLRQLGLVSCDVLRWPPRLPRPVRLKLSSWGGTVGGRIWRGRRR